jgi:uncharacterized 2Fe-2S/4Fe-4S cluster protein (DUF4445 family)
MADHKIIFENIPEPVSVPTGTLLVDASSLAGIEINQPCGGQGRCGRCIVKVTEGHVRRRSALRLTASDIEEGYALACQSVVEMDATVSVPEQEKIERRLVTDLTAKTIMVPSGYDHAKDQSYQRLNLTLTLPSMDDQTDDWSRLQQALRSQVEVDRVEISLDLLRQIGGVLRDGDWQVSAVIEIQQGAFPRLVDLKSGHVADDRPLWGIAIDIGTTTVSVWLVDLISGEIRAQVAEYNQQINRGEDVISRIIYDGKNGNKGELSGLVTDTINGLVEMACKRVSADPEEIVKATVTGNSTMIHLFLNIPAAPIRLSPFITAVNHPPSLKAREVGLSIHPEAGVDCLPGVASYVGADITAGVYSSGLDDTEKPTLFMDVGTNGEIALGSKEWLVTCACSAGPAFEGAGVKDGMRATKGAIEEVWVNGETFEPTLRVIGNVKPQGICGSGLISLLSELFLVGVIDKAGNVKLDLAVERCRQGEHGPEYVVVWGEETKSGQDIVITKVDVDNLLRAKAAIYAGFSVLAESVGFPLEMVEQVFIGGSFGQYINVEKAIHIGLFPDMPWEKFHFLGNTSVQGAYQALLDMEVRERISAIASRMTYIELSADNTFYDAFMSALFLPHTDLSKFPSVAEAIKN